MRLIGPIGRDGSYIRYKDKGFYQAFCLADADILNIFTLPLLKGDPTNVLREPYSIILTQEMAHKYFPNRDPIGQVLTVEDAHLGGDYKITGILKDLPANTSFHIDFLTATVPQNAQSGWIKKIWDRWKTNVAILPFQTFILLKENTDPDALKQKLPALITQYMGSDIEKQKAYHLQPLKRIHLYSNQDYGGVRNWIGRYSPEGNIVYIYLILCIAFFILLIACIKFMNLATARSATRTREVGLRKVVGAKRGQLIVQFLGESILLSLAAICFSLGLAELALPSFSAFAGKDLSLNSSNILIPLLFGILIFVGVLSGSYPACFLSTFQPVDVLKSGSAGHARSAWIRKGLVIFQFAISIILMISTIVVHNQMTFIQNQNLGFDKDQIVILYIFWYDRTLTNRYETVKQEFLKHPNITAATAAQTIPGRNGGPRISVQPEGWTDAKWQVHKLDIDEDFLNTYGIEIIAGRNYTRDMTDVALLNETAVKELGWTDPIGKSIKVGDENRTVIGVVKDFHLRPMHEKIAPVFILKQQNIFLSLSLKIKPDNAPETIAFIKEKWKQFLPTRDPELIFFDDHLNQSYETDQRLGRMFGAFSLLAVFVTCLGLLGLVSFTAQQRAKEIGIRKVLGASVQSIVILLSRDFMKLVIFSNIIAWPVAYVAADYCLHDFAYRIDVGLVPFLLGTLLAIFIAICTVSYQAIKAAHTNPVDTLRNE